LGWEVGRISTNSVVEVKGGGPLANSPHRRNYAQAAPPRLFQVFALTVTILEIAPGGGGSPYAISTNSIVESKVVFDHPRVKYAS